MGDHACASPAVGVGQEQPDRGAGRRGIGVMPEAGQAIIRGQEIGGSALPWQVGAVRGADAGLGAALAWRGGAAGGGVDRGVDVLGYLTLCGLPVPAHVAAAARLFRYNRRVFLAPWWDAIYVQDGERRQDRREAEATGRVMAETYARLGYDVVALPLAGIEARADFVLSQLTT